MQSRLVASRPAAYTGELKSAADQGQDLAPVFLFLTFEVNEDENET